MAFALALVCGEWVESSSIENHRRTGHGMALLQLIRTSNVGLEHFQAISIGTPRRGSGPARAARAACGGMPGVAGPPLCNIPTGADSQSHPGGRSRYAR